MRRTAASLALIVALVLPARAQVTLDLHALDPNPTAQAPSPAQPSKPAPASKPARPTPPSPRRAATQPAKPPASNAAAPAPGTPTPGTSTPGTRARPPAVAAGRPALPTAPPAALALPTIVVPAPAGKPLPPPPPPVSDSAGGAVGSIANGVRVLFTPDRADLAPDTVSGVKVYVDAVPKTDTTSFNVIGYAAGPPEDPSTPRRLSLSRALAVRSVLLAEGVPSERIYVRALGAAKAGGPADRVDVVALGTNGASGVAAEAPK